MELVREGAPQLADVLAYIHRGREPDEQHVQMDVTLGVYDVRWASGRFPQCSGHVRACQGRALVQNASRTH